MIPQQMIALQRFNRGRYDSSYVVTVPL